jgi:hypothetical protein
MISVQKIVPQTVELFDPQGNSMGFVNEYEFNNVRIQIKNAKAEGYYCMFEGKKFVIDKNGRSKDWFPGFFDLIEYQLSQLF